MIASNPRQLRKALAAAFIGTVIEWYDFFLYGTAAALVFGKLFFPNIDPLSGTMAAFATYAIGFAARPIGAGICGYLGDKYGRRTMLVWTLGVMGAATFGIGCLPTYATAGILAPILLVLLRCLQGLALGGEWGGAVLLAVEYGHQRSRGWYGSWAEVGVPVGLVLANGAYRLVSSGSENDFMTWGWRVPFWIGIILAAVGYVIRRAVDETPLFLAHKISNRDKNPIVEAMAQWRNILRVIGARIAENGCFYVFTVFILTYTTTILGLPRQAILNGVLIAATVEFFTIFLFAALSDFWGRRPIYLFGAAVLVLGIFPFFYVVQTGRVELIWLALSLALGVAHAAMYAPQAAFFSELFGTGIRYSATSMGFQLASVLAGGLAPSIATALLGLGNGKPWLVATYVAFMGSITFVSVLCTRETRNVDLSTFAN
jgi:MFS transporter, MHS family, shikimate and dehydroshikimate transport protein